MHLTPDQQIYWQYGFFKLNGTIVFTWALMLVLTVGSMLITRHLSTDAKRTRWQNLVEIIVTTIEKQIEDVGLPHPEKYLAFLGTLFVFVAAASLCTVIPGFEPPTGSLSTTAALALSVFVAVPFFGVEEQGLGGYLASYTKPTVIMLPFNIISELSRTLALAVQALREHDERRDDHRNSSHDYAVSIPDRHDGARPTHRHGAGVHLHDPSCGVHRGRDAHSRPQDPAGDSAVSAAPTKGHSHGQHEHHHDRGRVHRRLRHDHRVRSLGPRAGRREGGSDCAERTRPAARRVGNDHPDPVRRSRDD